MSGKVIAVANMKGGVGKTATVVGIAEAFAASGKSVLVIDLDAQANASICIAGDATLSDLMRRHCTIDGFIGEFTRKGWSTNFDSFIQSDVRSVSHQDNPLKLSLLASSPSLRDLERNLWCWVLGCAMTYSALFGVGKLLLGHTGLGLVLVLVATAAAWQLTRELSRTVYAEDGVAGR